MKRFSLTFVFLLAGPLMLTLLWRCSSDKRFLYVRPNALVFDTSASTPRILSGGESVTYSSHYLTVLMPVEEFSACAPGPGFSTATASYRKNRMSAIETIDKIQVIALKPYLGYAAGTDIAQDCRFYMDQSNKDSAFFSSPREEVSRQQVIDRMNNTYSNFVDDYNAQQRFSLRLPGTPLATSQQQFAIVFITRDNSRFSDTTVAFYLQP